MKSDCPTEHPHLDVLKRYPQGGYLLTASHGLSRNGMLVHRVQQVSNVPPTLIVSVQKGQPLSPLIRDRRAFAICELAQGDLLLNRIFETPRELHGEDPFLGLSLMKTDSGLPIPRSAASWIECDLIRHLDIEADYEIYIGKVIGSGVLQSAELTPATKSKARKPRKTARPGTDNRNGHSTTTRANGATKKSRTTRTARTRSKAS